MRKSKYSFFLFLLFVLALLAPLGFMSYSPLYAKGALCVSGMLFLFLLWNSRLRHGEGKLYPSGAGLQQGQGMIGDLGLIEEEAPVASLYSREGGQEPSPKKEATAAVTHADKRVEAVTPPPQPQKPKTLQTSAFEQELWNLPGFQSLLSPFKKGLSVDEFNPLNWQELYSNAGPGVSDPAETPFKHIYSFPSFGAYGQSLSNIEAFVKEMLVSLSEYLAPCSVSACLRSRTGKYHLFLQFSGSVFFSEKNTAMEGKAWERIIKRIEKGEYVILNEGKDLAFPLPSRFGPLGFLHFRCEEAFFETKEDKEKLGRLWYSIRKYGESLLQASIYERSIRDPESSLLNGIRFQEDLAREMACRLERNLPCRLILVLLGGKGKEDSEAISALAQKLSLLFPFPQRVYRIAQSLFSILDTRPLAELEKKLSELKTSLYGSSSLELSFGSALPALELSKTQEWFEEAQKGIC